MSPSSFPPAALQDNFNRADGSIDGTVTSAGGYRWASPMHTGDAARRISSNACGPNTAANQYDNCIIDHNFFSNIKISAKITALPADADPYQTGRIAFRIPYADSSFPHGWGTGSTYYFLQMYRWTGANNDRLDLYRYIDTSSTALILQLSIGDEWAVGDEVAISCNEIGSNTVIRIYRKPSAGIYTLLSTYEDSTVGRPSGTKVAIEGTGPSAGTPSAWVFDDLGIEEMVGLYPGDDPPFSFSGRGAGW